VDWAQQIEYNLVVKVLSCCIFMSVSFDIHPTAIIHPSAAIGSGCRVGPYSIVGPGVVLHENVVLDSHVVIECNTTIGEHSRIGAFSVLGGDPQHLIYVGQQTYLTIGHHAQIREHVTINRGTLEFGGETRVGDRVFLMVGVHIAHDCKVGSDVVMSNQVTLGGHVDVGDHAVLGGLCAVHQFTRIGEGAMIAGFSGVNTDVIPYGLVLGYRAKLKGINKVKLKRLHVQHEEIQAIYRAFQWVFQQKEPSFFERIQKMPAEMLCFSRVKKIQDFLSHDVKRSICMTDDRKRDR